MSSVDAFLAEIRLFSFNFAPKGWALCNGQLLPINQNQALFSLLGTTYGGNGQTTFALPDIRSRTTQHMGSSFVLGQRVGEEAHTVTVNEMPAHNHFVSASSLDGDGVVPTSTMLGAFNNAYRTGGVQTTLLPSTIGNVGGSQPHPNMQPFLVISFGICLVGIFPSRN